MSLRNLPKANIPSADSIPKGVSMAAASSDHLSEQIKKVAHEYSEIQEDLKDFGDAMKEHSRNVKQSMEDVREDVRNQFGEMNYRVLHIEQQLASAGDGNSGLAGIVGGIAGSIGSIGSMVLADAKDSHAYQALREWNQGTCRFKVNAPIRAALTHDPDSNGTTMPSAPERGAIVTEGRRRLRLLDALPSRPTTSDAVEFVQLHTTGDAEEQEAEGDVKAEIEFDGELRRCEAATVAGHTTVSKQVLSDEASLRNSIDQVLRYKTLSKLEHMIVNGGSASSSGGKISGFENDSTTFIPTIGTTPADIIGESLVRQADAGYLPNLVLMNTLDWFKLQITKNTDEEYLFGSPTMPVPEALWNQVVIPSPAVSEGRAFTIDTSFTTVLDREQPNILLSNSHKDYMTRNLVLILAELRAGLEVTDLFAVYKIDLITSGA